MAKDVADWQDFAQSIAIRAALGTARALPYRLRVPFMGVLTSRVVAPLARWDARVRKNLELVCPDLGAAEIRRLTRAVPDNAGRTLIEIFSPEKLSEIARTTPVEGPGFAALEAAQADGRPVILATGHFGNYEIARAALTLRGYTVGALYRPLSNRYFNERYVRAIEVYGTPMVAQGRRGTAEFVRRLKAGGVMGLLFDIDVHEAPRIDFMGIPARTATSAAELAVKYGAALIPTYGRRREDGFSFVVEMDAPVPHGDPVEMTRALNAGLETRIRANMDQWFWIHRRWKGAPAP